MLLARRQHRDRWGGRRRAEGNIGTVILMGLRERAFGKVTLVLVALGYSDNLAPVHLHRPLGRVFEAELKVGLGLLGVAARDRSGRG
jgi:hypothetical protein